MQLLTSKTEAIALIKNCPPVRDRFVLADDLYFDRMLEDSAATKGIDSSYRWRYVAARFLQVNPEVQLLESAEGAKFTRLDTPIRALLGEQAAEDNWLLGLGYTIPKGMEAIAALLELPQIGAPPKNSTSGKIWGSVDVRKRAEY
jgi:hypothetical protein